MAMFWLVLGGAIVLVTALVLFRRRMMDASGPGPVVEPAAPWDGRPRRASDRADANGGGEGGDGDGGGD